MEVDYLDKNGHAPESLNGHFWADQDPASPCRGCEQAAICGLFELACPLFVRYVGGNFGFKKLPPIAKLPSQRLYTRSTTL